MSLVERMLQQQVGDLTETVANKDATIAWLEQAIAYHAQGVLVDIDDVLSSLRAGDRQLASVSDVADLLLDIRSRYQAQVDDAKESEELRKMTEPQEEQPCPTES